MLATAPRTPSHRPLSDAPPLATDWLAPAHVPAFVECFQQTSSLVLDRTQFDPGSARGFWLEGRLVAGYRVVSEARRYAALVPDGDAAWPFACADAAETTHLWMAESLRPQHRRSVYGQLVLDLLATGQRFVVGGSVDPTIREQQMRMLPHRLFEGSSSALGVGSQRFWLYYGTPTTVVTGAIQSGVPVPWLAMR